MEESKGIFNVAGKITGLKDAILKLGKEPKQLISVLSEVRELLMVHHLAMMLVMYNNGSLQRLLQLTSQLYVKQRKSELMEVVYISFQFGMDCLLDFDPLFKKLFHTFKTKLPSERKFSEQLSVENRERLKVFKMLVKGLNQIKFNKTQQPYGKGLKINNFIVQFNKKLNLLITGNLQEQSINEVVITWLRKEVSELQRSIYKQRNYTVGLCCSLQFEKDQFYESLDFQNHFYLNVGGQLKPADLKNSQKNVSKIYPDVEALKKTIVYCLNNRGGYVFVGIQAKAKQGAIQGLALSRKDREEYLTWLLSQIVVKIFPTDGENEQEDDKDEKQRLDKFLKQKKILFSKEIKQILEYTLCHSIDMQFVNVYNKQTLLFERDQNGMPIYVLRLRVKVGDPAEVYFYLNPRDLPEAFIEKNKALTMIEYYDRVYAKLKDQANNKATPNEPSTHGLCRFSLKYEPQKKQEQEG